MRRETGCRHAFPPSATASRESAACPSRVVVGSVGHGERVLCVMVFLGFYMRHISVTIKRKRERERASSRPRTPASRRRVEPVERRRSVDIRSRRFRPADFREADGAEQIPVGLLFIKCSLRLTSERDPGAPAAVSSNPRSVAVLGSPVTDFRDDRDCLVSTRPGHSCALTCRPGRKRASSTRSRQ